MYSQTCNLRPLCSKPTSQFLTIIQRALIPDTICIKNNLCFKTIAINVMYFVSLELRDKWTTFSGTYLSDSVRL